MLQYPVERTKHNLKGLKSASQKRPKPVIPKSFIKKIKSLGLKEEDAEILYETKIDWSIVYSDNKIYCTEGGEQKCDFVAEIRGHEELRNHLREAHQWGDWPCSDKNCGYVAHSKVYRFYRHFGVFAMSLISQCIFQLS